jgi:hypothetical protein
MGNASLLSVIANSRIPTFQLLAWKTQMELRAGKRILSAGCGSQRRAQPRGLYVAALLLLLLQHGQPATAP